ncbi:hypothetical protein OY671_003839 [Metschnikowia pulcherrima]|nr:hypothetical protein OY671_003839 [Metschnikowia pulcherrima]
MNHAVQLDLAAATARYDAYRATFPQKKLPSPFKYDHASTVSANLDRLALFALHSSTTSAVYYAYQPVFLEIVARWIEKSDALEAAFAENQNTEVPRLRGATILLALSRICVVFPESLGLLEHFMASMNFAESFSSVVAELTATELHFVLLALYRIYAHKPRRFARFVLPQTLYQVLNFGAEFAVAKFLAVQILARYLNASEASRDEMLATHLKGASLSGKYDGNYKIDYHFFDLVEAKRLANLMALPADIQAPNPTVVHIEKSDLSRSVVSICGVLVGSTSKAPEPAAEKVVPTTNAVDVLQRLARAVQHNRPVMLHGQAGSGKTFLITQLATYLSAQDDIVKIHLGEQTDAKLLLGTYTSGEKPGSFEWRSGVLTTAVREGKWVLVEDIDKAPTEVLSILLTLLEKRELSIPSRGEVIRAHSDFKLISTVRTNRDSARVPDMIGHRLWEQIEVTAPGDLELRAILAARFPLLKNLIAKFISVYTKVCHIYTMTSFISLNKGSHPRVISTRDLMKWCSRCHVMLQNKGVSSADQLLESVLYDNIFAEAVECFGSAITEYGALTPLVSAIGEVLEMPTSRINLYLESYVPSFYMDDAKLEIGRAVLLKSQADQALRSKKKPSSATTFARTKHSKRLMEQIGVGIEMVEPVLLVGETGTGKTTVVQEVAKMLHKKLTVINVSQQTEAGDLLGGYKPVNTKSVATPLQEVFENLFLATFAQKKNAKFSALLSKCYNRSQWKNVIKLWNEAVKMAYGILEKAENSDVDEAEEGGPKKKRKLGASEKSVLLTKWQQFSQDVKGFEAQAANLENSFVFSFVEGSLVKAVRNGEWLLLDEINLASPDTLESIADLLSENVTQRSVLLSERGDVEAIRAHPDFRIFGCMNPSTDVGKRDLPLSIRSRFSEIYVHSPDRDREDLTSIIEKYIQRFAVGDDWAIEDIAELYYEAKALAESNRIVDGANQKPHFSIRTLTRTLIYVCDIVAVYGLRRALYEGFCMSFLTLLDGKSEGVLKPIIAKYTIDKLKNAKQVVARCPPAPSGNEQDYVQFQHYWMKRGPGEISTPNYIITPFVEKNLLNLVRATASRKFPVLVQGPTSAGKTSMINYLASITGHKFVRINNHEHTDLQEYLGTYISDSSGKLVFREGVLVEALRKGHWIVLDELNLAPTDVLEALNRLLDDNRELFIPETQEVVHPHPDFMLFATQNPPGLYGGRKVLSRAFRNRFLELHFDDIPQDELEIILKERCQIAPTYGKKIVEVYRQLSVRRQSSRLFEQKNSFATLRDLFRWALRDAVGYEELAANGYMLLAERVRSHEEKMVVKETIEKVMRVTLDMESYYEKLENKQLMALDSPIVWTKAMRRLAVLVEMSIKYNEPLLLVGETGCGKTTVCQILAQLLHRQLITVNAHQNTETGDILGAQRPIRNRFETRAELLKSLITFFESLQMDISLEQSKVEDLVKKYERVKKALAEKPNENIDASLIETIDEHIRASASLFEWADGPLINAMKHGEFFLLDEISLADDSVLERLNSVLEPERSLLLAEKGTEDAFLTAKETFQFLATMNPGGDYGKKELSPALRNRFTEIWVPSMDDFNDVQQIVESRLKAEFRHLSKPLVQFSEWFGKRLGNGNAHSGVISLRDILAWVEFINACDDKFSSELALINGAMMVFIDALGTNNTAYLADNEERLAEHKRECVSHLCSLIDFSADEFCNSAPLIEVADDLLKAGMFSIPRRNGQQWEESFNLSAPTTAANAMRVIRAMQVHKPILLEGSPGVGKTSLVSAISKATGNSLIRINLSEQTDLIDLFGSDAPVEGGNTGEFVWRDAPFLRAMKNGEWVLLDEMNLASQSVLEGLNACLDHRGEAYIPELDRSFPRHPDFKVFAAQNPQYQGGGRKGLPKSFVNRFSVVYMDVLKHEDLLLISAQIFPNVSRADCAKMIQFMTKLEEEVVVKRKWGMSGGPWEFNLRDTLRWLSLYSSKHNLSTPSDTSIGDFLDMIVCHRFRTPEDRMHVKELFEMIFGPQQKKDAFYGLGKEYVQAGGSLMRRNPLLQYSNSSDRLQFVALQTNFPVLEAAMRSVSENIPLILTGPSNSGKTELIRFLANVVGVKLSEFSMNSDVDSMDILGGYEQVDLTRAINALTTEVFVLLNELVVINLRATNSEPVLLSTCLSLVEFMESTEIGTDNFDVFVSQFKAFLSLYANERLSELAGSADELFEKLQEVSTVKFNWFDGMLVKAVARGEWLVLDNANLCNPSVLDRLNSLLEFNGSLIINECSQEDGSPRVLTPHPDFRLFLTVDPKYGELSRAMRNRCVELFVESLDDRATSFDRKCLGLAAEQADHARVEELDDMMEKLEFKDDTSSAKPVSALVASTDSSLRNLALVHDCVSADVSSLTGALAGIFGMSHFGKLKRWTKAFSSPEFDASETGTLEEVCSTLQHLQASGYVTNLKTLYRQTASSQVVTKDFVANQVLHPLVNRYILGYFEACDVNFEGSNASVLFQVISTSLKARSFIQRIEDKAINGKASDLSFIEKSAAVNLGRDIKKAPKVNIFAYVKAVSVFISTVFDASVQSTEFFKQQGNFYESLMELQCIWASLAEASQEQNLSKLRVYRGMVTAWLETHSDKALIAEHAREITSLRIGLELTSGFSMTKIWEHFRQTYPTSKKAWDNYAKLVALLGDFDVLATKLYPDTYAEVSDLRHSMLSLYDDIVTGSLRDDDLELVFTNFAAAFTRLAEVANAFVVERNNSLEQEFTMLSNFLVVSSYVRGSNLREQLSVATNSSRSTLSLLQGSKNSLLAPYPRIFDCLWSKDSMTRGLFTNEFFFKSLVTFTGIRNRPGKYLDQSLTDISAFGKSLVENSASVLEDQKAVFQNVLVKWILEILKAHDLEIPADVETSTTVSEDFIQSLLALAEAGCDEMVTSIMKETYLPALYMLVNCSSLAQLGKAWILFACGCIQLFVPNSPLDPAIEDHVTYVVYQRQQELCAALKESWKSIRLVISGNEPLELESALPSPGEQLEAAKTQVFRSNESMDELFDEWKSFLDSSIDREPMAKLMAAAENSIMESNSQKVGIFHNNSANFMLRLNSKYPMYADLNDILSGYIYSIRLGLDLLEIENKNKASPFEVASLWQIDIEKLNNVPAIETLFESVKAMNKTLGSFSVLSEKVMLYFINLCFSQTKMGDERLSAVVNQAFQSLYYRWYYRKMKQEEQAAQEGSLYKHKDTDDAERDFKELFPDYEDVMDIGEETGKATEAFDEVHYELAVSYVNHYLREKELSLSDIVQQGATLCSELQSAKPDVVYGPNSASQLSALLIAMKSSHESFASDTHEEVNFYHDPCPSQFRKAMKLVLSVYKSVAALLAQWPEHATLQTISRYADEFLSYPSSFPLNKLLFKIEILHNSLNEWEKFASSQVTLKTHFEDITNLIVSWRKLELSSWKSLFRFEDKTFEKSVGKWWFHLFDSVVIPYLQDDEADETDEKTDEKPSVVQVLGALNVFMSQTNFGEFQPRLDLVRALRNHISSLASADSDILNGLGNFIAFYEQFLPIIEDTVRQTKKTLEKDVSEVILLASWKDVNIDALKQSSRKSHNNLYKMIRKYRALLSTPVAPLVEAGIPKDSAIVASTAHDAKQIRFAELSNAEKLAVLQACQTTTKWSERPTRLRNIEIVENNLKVYIDKILRSQAPSLYEYAKQVIEQMDELRKETPSVMNDDTKKVVAALKSQKHKLLSDTFKELRRIGVKTTVKPEVKKVLATVNLILTNSAYFGTRTLQGVDGHYFRCLDILPRLRSAVASGNEEVPQADLERGLAASENLMFSLVTTRAPLISLSGSIERISDLCDNMMSVADNEKHDLLKASLLPSMQSNLAGMRSFIFSLIRVLDYALSVIDSVSYFHGSVNAVVFNDAKAELTSMLAVSPAESCNVYTDADVQLVTRFNDLYTKLFSDLKAWGKTNVHTSFVADVVANCIQNLAYKPFLNSTTSLTSVAIVEDLEQELRKLSTSIMVSVQKILELHQSEINDEEDGWLTLAQSRLMKSIKLLHTATIEKSLSKCINIVHGIEQNAHTSAVTSALVAFTRPLIVQYHNLSVSMLTKARQNYVEMTKSTFVLLRSLHTLASDGFCSPEAPSEQKKDDNLHDGTGLGDGEGATNNSKDEEEDDDLAEHAQQPNEEKNKDEEDDENDDAVDMEGDMAGDLEEASDQEKDDEDKDDDGEEEDLDEEVDDIDDLDPNAIDEKMWDEEAKDDEKEKDSEQMPQNSVNDDENMEANEEEEEKENADQKNEEKDNKDGDDEKDENDNDEDADEEEDVGEQDDEVKNDENEQLDEHVPETETLDLPEDMNMDDDDDNDDSGEEEDAFDDQMDVEEEEEEQGKDQKDETAAAEEDDNGEDEDGEDEEGENEEDGNDEDDNDENESELEGGEKEIDEEPQEPESDEETADGPKDEEEENKDEQPDSADKGEDAMEGDDGANQADDEDVDMDAATKTEAGEQGDGADNKALDEKDDIGTTGTASSDTKQEENKTEEAPTDDGARDEMKESLKQLGDSLKEFHRRRQEIQEASIDEKEQEEKADVKPDEFQHVDGENTEHDTQALGAADSKDQVQSIDEEMAIDDEEESNVQDEPDMEEPAPVKAEDDMDVDEADPSQDDVAENADDFNGKTKGGVVGERRQEEDASADDIIQKQELEETAAEHELDAARDEDFVINPNDTPAMSLEHARHIWRDSEIATQELASGLSEQLRLILEPTLATKLRGDYKTGKRLNMKRIISYIASDFRKDKIWLRRTKPAKRQYQIMIAVDDSKSMTESKSTELAFHSIALVSKALTQLESGGLSIVRFGEDVKLVHPFDKPFNQETGASVFQWFDFQQERTDIKQLCAKSLKIFENARSSSSADLWQLQIIISDGVCEDHATVQRLVRKAREEKVMLVFVVVDGITSSESILDMSQVSYVPDPVTGAMSLKVENYLDTFPFEFYVVVRNINELPEMLSLILRQYFSEVANM